MNVDWLQADWPAPSGIATVVTTRNGGVSAAPWDTFNPALHVGDNLTDVAANRERLERYLAMPQPVQWLDQVHGTACCAVTVAGPAITADAAYTRERGLPLAVMTADCLSVFFCNRQGSEIAVAHAGWRGLCAGVLEATVQRFDSVPGELMAWLGPAIGPQAFQVGPEVRQAFLEACPGDRTATVRAFREDGQGRFLADLGLLARQRLAACGVAAVYGGGLCTFSDPDRFFSYRRDGVTGRMASVIALRQ